MTDQTILDEAEVARRLALLDHLERRRAGHDAAMWQAPGLTIAAQAFLLQVLANHDTPLDARRWVLRAGVVMLIAAALALFLNRDREVRYSKAIQAYSSGLFPDMRFESRPRWFPNGPVLWSFVFVLFAVADFVVCFK
jgi:hypothetical protein